MTRKKNLVHAANNQNRQSGSSAWNLPSLLAVSLCLLVYFVTIAYSAEDPLTPDERTWLNEHDGKITVNNESGWPPIIDRDNNGQHYGIVMDYQRLLEKKLNFSFKLDKPDTWDNFMARFRQGELDVNNNLQFNAERAQFALFTKPYIVIPNVIIVRKERQGTLTTDQMRDMTVAVTKDFAIYDYIKNNLPDLKLVPQSNDLQCLLATSTKEVDAAVVNLAVASFLIEQQGIANLRVAGNTDFNNALCFASRKDLPILNGILEKGLAMITPAERQAIYRKWISLDTVPFYMSTRFWLVGGGISLIVFAFLTTVLVWNHSLKTQVASRTKKLETANLQLMHEIQERKKIEEALSRSEERFSLAMQFANDGLFDWDLVKNTIYFSPGWKRLVGYEDHELHNELSEWERLTSKKDMADSAIILDEVLQGKRENYQKEFSMQHKDGHWVNILARANVVRDESGKGVRLVGTHVDITERKQAEHDLRRRESQFRTLVNTIPDLIWLKDTDGVYLACNKKFERFFGANETEILGKTDYDFVEKELADFFRMHDRKALAAGRPSSNEEQITFADDGRTAILETTKTPMFDADGKLVGILGIGRDITERKQAEAEREKLQNQLQQAQKLEGIGTLAGGIAHDFNNILGAIVGYSEMVRDDLPSDSPSLDYINQVIKASHRAKNLIRQILAFSRQVESQKMPMQPAVIVKEAFTLLRSSLPTTINMQQDIDPDAGTILADPTQIHQIVMNLATNAFHAMEAKGGTLTISLCKKQLSHDELATEADLQPGAFVQLSIKDTGEGILPENRDKIFDPFFTTKEVGKGTGLGLSMVYSIVKSCHGAIACDSRLGEGTEFRILLPVLEDSSVQDTEATIPITHGREHILLIDDEEMLVELGRAMLKRLGYHVTTRTNSLDALATFQNQPDNFDLIITDHTMPGMTGVDLARRILQIRPQMPIILCTGYSSLISEDKAKAAGIKGFAYKPLTKKEISELITKVLNRKSVYLAAL